MKVYMVWEIVGQYDDRQDSVSIVFEDKKEAEEYVEQKNKNPEKVEWLGTVYYEVVEAEFRPKKPVILGKYSETSRVC